VPQRTPRWPLAAAGPCAACGPARRWWRLALVALLWVLAIVFVRTPPSRCPCTSPNRYFVLDATSMLFLLVINSVFLGISVYMSSRVSTSRVLAAHMLSRAGLTLAFMVAMNLGVMANNLLLLWAFIELTTLCAAPLVAQGDTLVAAPRGLALPAVLEHVAGAHLPGHPVPDALGAAAGPRRSTSLSTAWPQRCPSGDGWQRLGLALMLFGLGSKLGLAPLYSWLPETYEAAPTSTSALLAAVQFNISIVAVLRVLQVFRGHDTGFVRTSC
jgi:hydrogenase-4 component F